jgi:hypothetical protein
MSEHIFDELPLLLTGEADRATVAAVALHLRDCADCQQELISALVAHASLSSAARFARDAASTVVASAPSVAPAQPRTLPEMSVVFAQVRAEVDADTATQSSSPSAPAAAPARTARSARTPNRRGRWLAAAAVAAVVTGGTLVAVQQLGQPSSGRKIQLAPYDKGSIAASATLASDRMKIDATALPKPSAGQGYEIWLTDAARKNLQPIGWIGADGHSTITLPTTLARKFTNIEVSVQSVEKPYLFFGTSVLRGAY